MFRAPRGTAPRKRTSHQGRANPNGAAISRTYFGHTVCPHTRSTHSYHMKPPMIPLTSHTLRLRQHVLRSPVARRHANTLPTKPRKSQWRCDVTNVLWPHFSLQLCKLFPALLLNYKLATSESSSEKLLPALLLEEVSYETLVLETCRFTFGGSLARNARFGDGALHFWRKSRTKRAFWRLGGSLLEGVSCETLVLEFGDGALHFWRKSRTKRSFWTQKWPGRSTNVVRERAFRSWSQFVVQM